MNLPLQKSLVRLFILLSLSTWLVCCGGRPEPSPDVLYVPQLSQPPSRVYLDVDNTLYRDSQLLDKAIGSQIVRGVKAFCRDRCNLSDAQTDGLYEIFGSTEEGMRRTIWKNSTMDQLKSFLHSYYANSYAKVDVSGLLPIRGDQDSLTSATGYSHALAQQRTIRKLLSTSPSLVTLSSNSPAFHVRKVVQALGLCQIFDTHDILTPDSCASSHTKPSCKDAIFPTKVSPVEYFGSLKRAKDEIVLIDDSSTNLKAVQRYMKGYRVSDEVSLLEALAKAWGWLDQKYEFSPIEYLKAKNEIDQQSLNRQTWKKMLNHVVAEISARTEEAPWTIVDVGAGLLSMHKALLREEEGNKVDDDLPSLLSTLALNRLSSRVTQINYVAYEPNVELRNPCVDYLLEKGYVAMEEYAWDTKDGKNHVSEMIFEKNLSEQQLTIRVSLRFWDFRNKVMLSQENSVSPDLVIGCCFADLLAPDELVRSILKCFLIRPDRFQSSALLYFPITFWGVTQFIPSCPCAINGTAIIPSDTQAFAAYTRVLRNEFDHHLVPRTLVECFKDHGGELLAQGSSDWHIDSRQNEYMWRTMLYFFATAAAPELQAMGYDANAWIRRAWGLQPSIMASNIDLLLKLPFIGKWRSISSETPKETSTKYFLEIEFSAPKSVSFVNKQRRQLKAGEIRIKTVCSLISSGTELKIFTGAFDDEALDVNIKSMEGKRMGYPLAYGYSLVGAVVECGEGVDAHQFQGKLVFAFSAHASEVLVQADAVHVVPDGIDPLDAVFMPSVETALSIIHDAHPRLGENIIVFGQGLIGLLVTSLLSSSVLSLHPPSLTTVDALPERLALSASFGSQQALFPEAVDSCDSFDVAIEASGNFRALQSAIDCTKNGGRVIVASWYGNDEVLLKLGIGFHRSHKEIKTSQVSKLPAALRETWTKQRRFNVVWDILRDLRPSRLVTRKASPSEAGEVYAELLRGEQVAVAFEY